MTSMSRHPSLVIDTATFQDVHSIEMSRDDTLLAGSYNISAAISEATIASPEHSHHPHAVFGNPKSNEDLNEKRKSTAIGHRPIIDSESRPVDVEKAIEPKEAENDSYPEGGFRAWSVVIGSSLLTFSTFGYANSWGIFQQYYQQELLMHETPSNIAWIGSIQYALVLMPGIISGRLMDLGHLHIPLATASAVHITAIFLAAECTKYWQFMLCQGFLLGLACGFEFGPSLAVVSHWFQKKRAMAFGVVAIGSSLGGVIFPIAVRRLLPLVGFKWTMRITGFMVFFTLGLANILVKRRLPPKPVKGGMFNFPVFKNAAFSLYAAACVVGFLGIYTVLTFDDVSASEAGISDNVSYSLVSIANGASFIGRLLAGYFAGTIGPLNVLTPMTIIAGITTWAWPYAALRGPAALIIVSVIYGISSGAFVGLIGTPMSHPVFGDQGDIGRRIGMLFTLCAIGALCGPPISGAIHTATGGYTAVGWYAGTVTMLSVVLLVITRRVALGEWHGKF